MDHFRQKLSKYKGTHRLLVFVLIIFIVLPVIKLSSTIDPELTPRTLIVSIFVFLFSVNILFSNVNHTINCDKRSARIFFLMIFILFWMAVSMIGSINTGDSFSEWLRIAVLFGVLLISYHLFRTSSNVPLIISRATVFAVLIFSIFAFIQIIEILPKYIPGKPYQFSGEVCSSLANKNFFSETLLMFLPLLIFGLINDKMKWKILFIIALSFSLFFILLLQTISAWIAVFFTIIFYFVLAKKNNLLEFDFLFYRKYRVLIIATIVVLLTVSTIVYTKTSNYRWLVSKAKNVTEYLFDSDLLEKTRVENNNSVFERFIMWRNSMKMIAEYPLLGAGLNNWKLLYKKYGIGGTQYINSGFINYEHPHNDYLLIWSEQGPVGILLYLLFLIAVLVAGIKKIKGADEKNKQLLLLLLCSVLSFTILSVFGYPRSREYSMLLLMIVSALIISMPNKEADNRFSLKPIALVLILISFFGSVASFSRLNGEIHIKNTIEAQINGSYARMMREADKAYSWYFPLDITATPISWYKGMSYFYSGNVEEAKHQYEEAIKINPYHLRVLNDLATSFEQTGEKEKAIYYYRKALEVTPLFIEGNLNISAAYFNLSKIDSAFYFIDKVYNLPMSMGEENNYKKFLDAILYVKAYNAVLDVKDSIQISKMLPLLGDKATLVKIYRQTKSLNTSFNKAVMDLFSVYL